MDEDDELLIQKIRERRRMDGDQKLWAMFVVGLVIVLTVLILRVSSCVPDQDADKLEKKASVMKKCLETSHSALECRELVMDM